jgi:hypothetical protein
MKYSENFDPISIQTHSGGMSEESCHLQNQISRAHELELKREQKQSLYFKLPIQRNKNHRER